MTHDEQAALALLILHADPALNQQGIAIGQSLGMDDEHMAHIILPTVKRAVQREQGRLPWVSLTDAEVLGYCFCLVRGLILMEEYDAGAVILSWHGRAQFGGPPSLKTRFVSPRLTILDLLFVSGFGAQVSWISKGRWSKPRLVPELVFHSSSKERMGACSEHPWVDHPWVYTVLPRGGDSTDQDRLALRIPGFDEDIQRHMVTKPDRTGVIDRLRFLSDELGK